MSKIKKISLTFLVYGIIVILATILFIGLFHTPILKNLNVFFYRGCIFLLLAAICAVFMILIARKLFPVLSLDEKDALVIFVLFLGFTLGWYTLLPVTVERSISVYMLSYMEQNSDKGLTSEEFGDIFYENYITKYGAFEKRFDEQVLSGNIETITNGDGYVITQSGRTIVNLFRLCSNLFGTEQWLVYPNDYEIGYSSQSEEQ